MPPELATRKIEIEAIDKWAKSRMASSHATTDISSVSALLNLCKDRYLGCDDLSSRDESSRGDLLDIAGNSTDPLIIGIGDIKAPDQIVFRIVKPANSNTMFSNRRESLYYYGETEQSDITGQDDIVTAFKELNERIALEADQRELDDVIDLNGGGRLVASDCEAPICDRVDALYEWIDTDNDSAAAFILAELGEGNLKAEWRNALIFAVEDVRLQSDDQQELACRLLRNFATQLRKDTDVDTEQVVWSALRRYASLLPSDDAAELMAFLKQDGGIDTRLVALQCILSIFEERPPQEHESIKPLADRVFAYATKLLDEDVLVAGETSAIAEQAICALAALGDSRFPSCLEKLNKMGVAWLSQAVRMDLESLLEVWSRSNTDLKADPAYQQLAGALTCKE